MNAEDPGRSSSPPWSPVTVTLDVSAIPQRAAGAGQYVLALARELAALDTVSPTLVSRSDDVHRWRRAVSSGSASARVLPAAPRARPARLVWEQLGLPRLLAELAPQVHHGPHYTMPERSPVPTVVTVHDCTFFDHPEWHQRTKVLLFRRAIKVAARRAGALVCVSRTTAERLWALCEVRAPVVVAPHGVDLDRFSPKEPEVDGDREALAALGIDAEQPYLAFVGTIEPRKGVATLIRAFGRLRSRHPELRLVLAGQQGWGTAEVQRALSEAGVQGVVQLGYVGDPVVPALLRRAAGVAYPSLAEGYGLPALEAMACGAPLVTTQGTAMAEVAGGAAVLVPPGDPSALAEALEAVLEEPPGRRQSRREVGLAAAAQHTWAASAARHLEAYRQAASREPGGLG